MTRPRTAGLKRDMLEYKQRMRAEERRRHLLPFVEDSCEGYKTSWVQEHQCAVLEQFEADCRAGLSPRLLIVGPPGFGKSFITSERFPVWAMGRAPGTEVLLTSYGADPAKERSENARDLMNHPVVAETFPGFALKPSTRAKVDWKTLHTAPDGTTKQSSYKARSLSGAVTSHRAHILIVDDPIRGWRDAHSKAYREQVWDSFTADVATRLHPGAGIIVIQTRWHKDDLAGRLLEEAKAGGEQWTLVHFEAIASADGEHQKKGEALQEGRFSLAELEVIKRRLNGGPKWLALYMGKPTSSAGTIIKRKWCEERYRVLQELAEFDEMIVSVDLSGGAVHERASFHAFGLIGRIERDYYLCDLEVFRAEMPEAVARLTAFRKRSAYHEAADEVLVENKALGRALLQSYKRAIPGMTEYNPGTDSKAERLEATQLVWIEGRMHLVHADVAMAEELPEGQEFLREFAEIIEAYVDELCNMPGAKFDDQADMTSQILNHLEPEPEDEVWGFRV